MTTIPIRDQTGWYGWTLWISVVLCGFSLAVNLLYVYGERKFVPSKYRLSGARSRAIGGKKGKFQYRQLFSLPWCFWMLPMTQLLQSEAAGAFGNSATDLITMKGYEVRWLAFNMGLRLSKLTLAYRRMSQPLPQMLETVSTPCRAVACKFDGRAAYTVLPIVVTPFIGLAVDRYGHRLHLTALAPLLWITACAVIGWSDVHPLLPVVISSFAGMINSFPFQVTIPLLVLDQDKLGTAFGVWRS